MTKELMEKGNVDYVFSKLRLYHVEINFMAEYYVYDF